jgi:hypothetical protein
MLAHVRVNETLPEKAKLMEPRILWKHARYFYSIAICVEVILNNVRYWGLPNQIALTPPPIKYKYAIR